MTKSGVFSALVTVVALTGCQSSSQTLADEQTVAMQTAVKRGQFELGCPAATGQVLSNQLLQPVLWGGIERAEYQVGVSGCNKRATYIVVCQVGSPSCVAAASTENAQITQ